MLFACYLIPLAAWYLFTYNMHHSGGRPTTDLWWAFMTGLGTFELGKGLFTELRAAPPLGAAMAAGIFAAGVVLVIRARRRWIEEEGVEADLGASAAVGR